MTDDEILKTPEARRRYDSLRDEGISHEAALTVAANFDEARTITRTEGVCNACEKSFPGGLGGGGVYAEHGVMLAVCPTCIDAIEEGEHALVDRLEAKALYISVAGTGRA